MFSGSTVILCDYFKEVTAQGWEGKDERTPVYSFYIFAHR